MNSKTKYRPYLTLNQIALADEYLVNALNDRTVLISPSNKRDIQEMHYMFEDILRKAEREGIKPAYVPKKISNNLSKVRVTDMFSDIEIISSSSLDFCNAEEEESPEIKPKVKAKLLTDHEILANASEYEQDIIFLNEELRAGFISQELYQEKLLKLQIEHNIKE